MQKGESWMDYEAGTYEIAVIGGGHAGIEAALAAARLGAQTVLFTMSLDAICPVIHRSVERRKGILCVRLTRSAVRWDVLLM